MRQVETRALPNMQGTPTGESVKESYRYVREFSRYLCEPLEIEDFVVQTMPGVSPTKWHLAHTSWFFETFILREGLRGYTPYHPEYHYLFNSYYNTVGRQFPRPERGLLSRPTVEEVFRYRDHVDACMEELLSRLGEGEGRSLLPIIQLGLHHEQQHQELMLTDIKNVLGSNPLKPAYRESRELRTPSTAPPFEWILHQGGLSSIGFYGPGFSYDNETPRHRVYLNAFMIGSRPVTNGEFLRFIGDDGYSRHELWLSDGWATVKRDDWKAPLYWEKSHGEWWLMTLAGMRRVLEDEPVCHVSFYEADAFAAWAGARLPTEAEWEVHARNAPLEGNFVEDGILHPAPPAQETVEGKPQQLFGDIWEWTQSSYSPYPGYRPLPGAIGEYNGKFMSNQKVLRGGSVATSRTHIRPTYRNFFYPDERWQFMGLRLAKDA